jgi:hypothetical protein
MRILPKITYKGKKYFIDERLREFCSDTKPIKIIPFDSEKGQKIQKLIFK